MSIHYDSVGRTVFFALRALIEAYEAHNARLRQQLAMEGQCDEFRKELGALRVCRERLREAFQAVREEAADLGDLEETFERAAREEQGRARLASADARDAEDAAGSPPE